MDRYTKKSSENSSSSVFYICCFEINIRRIVFIIKMATYGDTLNQTFPGISSNNNDDNNNDELHHTFHTPSINIKSNRFNFEQQFLFGKKKNFFLY